MTPEQSMAAPLVPGAGPPSQVFTKAELSEFFTSKDKFKKFLKLKCGECGVAGFRRFKSTSPYVVEPMLDTLWCKDCQKVLCENHRHLHKCEKLDIERLKRHSVSREQILKEAEDREKFKLQAQEKAQAEHLEQAKRYHIMKSKRKQLAGKAAQVANFIQRLGLQDGPNQSALLEMYPRANRISIFLLNESIHPTGTAL